MDVQLFDLSWVICFTICGLRIGRPYFMSVFYSTTFFCWCCPSVAFLFLLLFLPIVSTYCHFFLTLVLWTLCWSPQNSWEPLILVATVLVMSCLRSPSLFVILLRFLHQFCVYVLPFSVGRCRSSGSICFCGDSVWQQRQSYSCELTVGQIFLHHWHGAAIVTQLSGRSLPMNACSRLVVAYLHLFECTV